MNIAQELERLAKLHADGALTAEEFTNAKQRLLSGERMPTPSFKNIRRHSSRKVFGLPLWAVAIGPDWERGEMRGHARGIFAFGDIATGWVACGGIARGFLALGGVAVGLAAFGGGAVGILLAAGGAAVGGVALGGGVIGIIAIGGGAWGYYALGGGASGVHAASAVHRDPVAVDFFRHYLPWIANLVLR